MLSIARSACKLGRGPIARGSITSLAIRAANLALSFGLAVLTARVLGVRGYGTVAVALAIVQILATLCAFGLGSLAVREIPALLARSAAPAARLFVSRAAGTVVLLSLLGGAVLVLAVAAFAGTGSPMRGELLLAAAIVVPTALLLLFRGTAQGFGRVAAAQWPSEILRPAAAIALLAGAAVLGLAVRPGDYLAGFLAVSVLSAIVAGMLSWRALPAAQAPLALAPDRAMLAGAAPFLGMGLAAALQAEINTLLLGWLASREQAGLFQPIAKLAPLMTVAVQSAAMAYAPRVAALWQSGDRDTLVRLTRRFTLATSVATVALVLPLVAAGPWLLAAFGPEFAQVAPLLAIVGAAQALNAACGPVGFLLAMTGRPGAALVGQLVGLAANVAVGLWLIPSHGALGGAIAMALGIVLWNLTLLVRVRRELRFDPSLRAAPMRLTGAA
ncbi:MAG TPA: oligosaccharide flippase family protein [Croceibacterium sp.]|nr:oligosaccharide flippase family protein [Croceibacterium sp.]